MGEMLEFGDLGGSRSVDRIGVDARAASFAKRSLKGETKRAGLRLALSMVDLTTLEGKDTEEKVLSLCRKAVRPGDAYLEEVPSVAAVCVYPTMVRAAREGLERSGRIEKGEEDAVKVAAVVTGFPSGQYPFAVRMEDARRAIGDGADEVDMVISRGAFLSGDEQRVFDEVARIGGLCVEAGRGSRQVTLKVILETGELETLDNVRRASDIAMAAMRMAGLTRRPGAGFIKTSTGKVEPAATMAVTLVMLEAIRDHYFSTGEMVGMKPAGGIRTAKQALHYLVMLKETLGMLEGGAWMSPRLFRFGASALVNDLVRQLAWVARGRYAAGYDFAEA